MPDSSSPSPFQKYPQHRKYPQHPVVYTLEISDSTTLFDPSLTTILLISSPDSWFGTLGGFTTPVLLRRDPFL